MWRAAAWGSFATAPWFGRWYGNPLYAGLLRVAPLSFLIRPFFNVPNNMLHRDMRFNAKTAVQLANLVIYNGYNRIALSLSYLGRGAVEPVSGSPLQFDAGDAAAVGWFNKARSLAYMPLFCPSSCPDCGP